ncbi:hypothetical protein ANN_05865 [Periplaneta americana]|uniref:Reverse transcriptase domain-containing protein n=1 Tax=Periplaneta americana TaxID=6978 RepID=A0ABQ8TDP4_PERAM|nr:hypothetical protein ANN_05865 [Periplaneta americana]
MAGLCEGGNEPPGSLKASKQDKDLKEGVMWSNLRALLMNLTQILCTRCSLFERSVVKSNMRGVMAGGRRMNCIRFSDDMALLVEEQLIVRDKLLDVGLNDSCEQYGMKINANKTKSIIIRSKIKKDHKGRPRGPQVVRGS